MRRLASARAAALGRYCSFAAAFRMRLRVASEIREDVCAPFRTADAAMADTPAARPTSARVGARPSRTFLGLGMGETRWIEREQLRRSKRDKTTRRRASGSKNKVAPA